MFSVRFSAVNTFSFHNSLRAEENSSYYPVGFEVLKYIFCLGSLVVSIIIGTGVFVSLAVFNYEKLFYSAVREESAFLV